MTQSAVAEQSEKYNVKRCIPIDHMRGAAILIYLLTQTAAQYASYMPLWFMHDAGNSGIPYINLGFMDFGPATFYFIIGLNIVSSFRRRLERKGAKAAYSDMIYRNLALIALDALVMFFVNKFMYAADWGIIRSVGLVGLLMLPFLNAPATVRAVLGITILSIYQAVRGSLFFYLGGTEGGVAACFGFLTIVLLTSALRDLYDKGLLHYFLGLLAVSVAAALSMLLIPIAYREFNSSYLLLTLLVFGIVFLVFAFVDKYIFSRPIPVLTQFGQSLIVFFLIGASAQLYIKKLFPPDMPFALTFALCFEILLAISAAMYLDRRNIIIKISPR